MWWRFRWSRGGGVGDAGERQRQKQQQRQRQKKKQIPCGNDKQGEWWFRVGALVVAGVAVGGGAAAVPVWWWIRVPGADGVQVRRGWVGGGGG